MVLGLNPTTDDTLNLTGAGCCGVVSPPRFGSPWRVLRTWPWNVPRLSKEKKKSWGLGWGVLYCLVLVYEGFCLEIQCTLEANDGKFCCYFFWK